MQNDSARLILGLVRSGLKTVSWAMIQNPNFDPKGIGVILGVKVLGSFRSRDSHLLKTHRHPNEAYFDLMPQDICDRKRGKILGRSQEQ